MENKKLRLIGDIHGKFNEYIKLIDDCDHPSIQLGDHGIGFVISDITGKYFTYQPYVPHHNHKFIRGNHDNPAICKIHPSYLYDGYCADNYMCIGGAVSIDAAWRVKNESWWEDEELTHSELNNLVVDYTQNKPDIMLTHECPESISNLVLGNSPKFEIPSRTRQAFEAMLHFHKPKLWVFGHWHKSFDYCLAETRFICLTELETIDIEHPKKIDSWEDIQIEWVKNEDKL